MTDDQFTKAEAAVAYLQSQTSVSPRVGIILGSGLGEFGKQVEKATNVPYSAIPHFPQSTVEGHSGNLILGEISGVRWR